MKQFPVCVHSHNDIRLTSSGSFSFVYHFYTSSNETRKEYGLVQKNVLQDMKTYWIQNEYVKDCCVVLQSDLINLV